MCFLWPLSRTETFLSPKPRNALDSRAKVVVSLNFTYGLVFQNLIECPMASCMRQSNAVCGGTIVFGQIALELSHRQGRGLSKLCSSILRYSIEIRLYMMNIIYTDGMKSSTSCKPV